MMIKKVFSTLLIGAAIWSSCQKSDEDSSNENEAPIKEDTLSIATKDTIKIVRGKYYMSGVPDLDSSTQGLKFALVNVKDLKTGKDVPGFLDKKYDVYQWSNPFDATTDTTMALVNQKLVKSSATPLQIDSLSGQLIFNSVMAYLPEGTYSIDVRGVNPKSSKLFRNFAVVKMDAVPFECPGSFGDYFVGISSDGKENAIKNLEPYTSEEMEKIKENSHPNRKLWKMGESDIVEVELVVKDAEGTTFPPKAIERWWDNTNQWYYNSYHDNSLAINGASEKISYTDTSCIFRFPTVPYPAYGSSYNSGDNVYLGYASINSKYWRLTDYYQQLANSTGVIYPSYQVRFKNSYKINEPGKWFMEVTSPFVICTRRN